MQLDEAHINQLIHFYKKIPSEEIFTQIQEIVASYSDFWVKRYYHFDMDFSQDFIVYILEFMEQILQSYPVNNQDIKVQSWFNAVLYYKFCDFVKTKDLAQSVILSDNLEEYYFLETESSSSNCLGILDKLAIEEKALWMFYNIPQYMDAELLIILSNYVHKPLPEILMLYQEVLTIYYDSQKLQELAHQKIKQIDNKMAHLQNMIAKSTEDEYEILQHKLVRIQHRQKKYIRSLQTTTKKFFKVFVKLFNNYNTAYRISKKIELSIKKILMQDSLDL